LLFNFKVPVLHFNFFSCCHPEILAKDLAGKDGSSGNSTTRTAL